jgi:hypothetical protein
MPAKQELTIRATYTGIEANLKPAASAFARMIREITNTDGTFKDQELEAEFQKWRKDNGGQVQELLPDRSCSAHRALRA